jgi:hypothetical protein
VTAPLSESSGQLEWLTFLAGALRWAAAAVLALSVIAAIAVASASSDQFVFGDVERQGRALVAIGALGGGVLGAGILAALGGILELMLAGQGRSEGAGAEGPASDTEPWSPPGDPRDE